MDVSDRNDSRTGLPASDTEALLQRGDLTARGFLANASNHTLLVQVGTPKDGVHAVYKPRAGERPLWDFPPGTLYRREAAARLVDAFLGWGLVPPTVVREDGPMGPGSVQLFVPHDPEVHYFVLVEDPQHHDALARMALFDLLVNNADRKASHVLLTEDGGVLGCDHGLTFNTEPKLRTVIWEFGARSVPAPLREDLGRLAGALGEGAALRGQLAELLSSVEIDALAQRASLLRGLRALPDVAADSRPYPWPPL